MKTRRPFTPNTRPALIVRQKCFWQPWLMTILSALFLTLLHVVSTTYGYHMGILNLAQMADSCNLCKIQDSLHWLQLLALDLGCPDRNPRSGAFALSVSWQSLRHGGRGVHLLRCAVSSLDLFAKSLLCCRPQKRPQVSAFATLLSVRGRFSVTQQPLAFSSNNMLTIVF